MKNVRTLAKLILCSATVWMVDCGGGPSGTGLAQSSISGNVSSVQAASVARIPTQESPLIAMLEEIFSVVEEAHAQNELEGITVRVAGTDDRTTTDGGGLFDLDTAAGGRLTLVFERDDVRAVLRVIVPRGGRLVLRDVDVDGRAGAATAADNELNFNGEIVNVDCLTQFADVADDQDSFSSVVRVDLIDADIVRQNGRAGECSDLAVGQGVAVAGRAQQDDSVEASRVRVTSGG